MRRRRGPGPAPAEACGVWLDTAQLKRGPARPLSAKLRAATRIPERKQSLGLLPQAGGRQSTIPSFFCPHTDERDKENSRPTPCAPNEDCKDSGVPLPACPVKILALPQLEGAREEPPGAEQGVQGTWKTPQDVLELQGEPQRQSRGSFGAGGDSSPSQGSAHKNKSGLFPGETASGSRKAQPWGRVNPGTGFAGAEDTNPAPGDDPRGVCGSPQRAQPLREWGQTQSCRELFCQDSQGNRVIAHRARDSSLRARDSSLGARDSSLGARDSSLRARDSSLGARQQLELGPECLFTQDSQGNRVIKHWQ